MIDQLRNGPEAATNAGPDSSASVARLVSGIVKDIQDLTRQQLALFKQEVADDFRKTREVAVAWALALGGVIIGVLMLAVALAELLTWGTPLPRWACYGIVAVAAAVLGAGLFYAGKKKLESFNPLPDQSVQALKENVQCLTNLK